MTIMTPSYSFTRPADTTAYATGDIVANSTTAGSVVPLSFSLKGLGGNGIIRGAKLYKSSTTATTADFAINLFATTAPTPTNGDNGAYAVSTTENMIGQIAVTMSSGAFAGTSYLFKPSAATAIGVQFSAVNDKIFGFITLTGAAYTPASGETFKVVLDIEGER